MRLLTIICAVALCAAGQAKAGVRWVGSWAASPAPPMPAPANNPARGTPTFNNQTLVQIVRLSAGGQRLRLRLSNEYGTQPLQVGAARVALISSDGATIAGTDRAVTFGGGKAATLPPGAPLYSDPIALPIRTLARLRISLYLPGDTHGCTCHMSGLEYVAVGPDDATETGLPAPKGPAAYRAFLTAVDVETAAPPGPVIVTFGDSITDGFKSTDGANRRWPDRVAERLAAAQAGRAFGVNNAGIGGNRVIAEGLGIFGQSALSRFDRDVLSVAGATHVVVLEGVNDLGMGKPTAEQIVAGYGQLIARAHSRGLKIIGATILPYEGAAYFNATGEGERKKINAWIRASKAFDGVIDFDAATRDPAKPERMRAELQSGDWLHPNDAGYRAMGDAVDLAIFR